jgi:ribosomal protein S18
MYVCIYVIEKNKKKLNYKNTKELRRFVQSDPVGFCLGK